MTYWIHRRGALRIALAWGCTIPTRGAKACEFITGTLTVVHPWVRATPEGVTTAAVCMGFKDIVTSDRLIDARTAAAERVEMAGTSDDPRIDFLIPAGDDTAFSESGPHLKLVGLTFPLGLGTTYPLSLLFQKAGPVEAQLSVDYARFR